MVTVRRKLCSLAVRDTYYGQKYLHVYNLADATQELSTTAYGAYDVKIGDVDADGRDEIVLASGHILDGASHTEEWAYVGGFGVEIGLADIDGDPALEIIGMSSTSYITAFDGEQHTPLWQINTDSEQNALHLTDLEGDGKIEILMGNAQGGVHCYSAVTQQKLWQVDNSSYGVTNIATGDPDGDNVKEVLWGTRQSFGGAGLFIAGAKNRQVEWQSKILNGPFYVDVFDVENDGVPEIVGASRSSNGGYNAGAVFVHDGFRHSLEWFSNELSFDYYGNISALAAGNINQSGTGEIVVGLGSRLSVWDGVSHRKIWESPDLNTSVNAIALADVDNDHTTEIVVGDERGYITIYNGETLAQERPLFLKSWMRLR